MSAKYFLDTNVVAYCFDRRVPSKQAKANDLVRRAVDGRVGVISYQVVQEFINVALKKFAVPMRVGDLEQYVTLVLRPMVGVSFSMALCQRALSLWDGKRRSWYDCLIIAAALEAGCEVLYSEDMQHGQRIEGAGGGLRVMNPFV